MARLTRAQQQDRTRTAVLGSARAEFAEHGYAEAKVDRIADRAEMTRGAVYSNFPSKRALYLAVLLDMVNQHDMGTAPPSVSPEVAEALGAFARRWLERLPLAGDTLAGGKLVLRSLTGVLEDQPARMTLAQVTRLEALLLALALETRDAHPAEPRTRVRLAELVLTLLNGSGYLADTAPGFGDVFDTARACEHLVGLDLADTWDPPYLPYTDPAHPCQDPWTPPTGLADLITGQWVDVDTNGVVVVLGTHRLEAAEEAIRGAGAHERVTVAIATRDPAEIGRLVRLRIRDLVGCLRPVFAPDDWPGMQLVLDDGGLVASALGVPTADDTSEAAVRIRAGTIVARAQGPGAGYAVATASDLAQSGGVEG